MTIREASAEWQGALKEGSGRLRLGSGVFEGAYSFPSRFENGTGTNPEELIAAAHAGCFSMALSAILGREGHIPRNIRTTAKVHLGATAAGPTITRIELETQAEVAELGAEEFERLAQSAKTSCLVSRALAGVADITLKAALVDAAEDNESRRMTMTHELVMDIAANDLSRQTAEIMRRFNDMFQRHDPTALAELVAEDCVIENTVPAPDGARHAGKAACVALWSAIATQPGTRFEIEETFVAGDRATIRWRYFMTDGNSLRGVNLMRVAGGRIVEAMGYVKG